MKYLLSEEEYQTLLALANKKPLVNRTEKQLQKLCTKICDEMPVEIPWGDREKKPWGCILSKSGMDYCDECPVQDICPYTYKEWSQ